MHLGRKRRQSFHQHQQAGQIGRLRVTQAQQAGRSFLGLRRPQRDDRNAVQLWNSGQNSVTEFVRAFVQLDVKGKTIGLDLRLNHDIEIRLVKKKRDYFFSVYEYAEPVNYLSHYVYNNKFDGEYLLNEFRHFDFLWLMKGDEVTDDTLQKTIATIRTIPSVQLITELAIDKINNKENLVF